MVSVCVPISVLEPADTVPPWLLSETHSDKYDWSRFNTVIIGEGVEYIGNYAFYGLASMCLEFKGSISDIEISDVAFGSQYTNNAACQIRFRASISA